MPKPSEEIVRRVLGENGRDVACRRAVEKAWEDVRESYTQRAWWRRKSSQRGIMWEHSVDNAIRALSDAPGVSVVRHHDTVSFVFDDSVLVRFKKASVQLHTSNVPTFLASLFHQHEADLFGYNELHRVEVAHVHNHFETGLDWIAVVAREKNRVLWHYELDGSGAAIELFSPPTPVLPAGDRVIRPTIPASEMPLGKKNE